jgi:hypothetical protein
MDELRYTLLSDGSANKALMPILTWILQQHLPTVAILEEWADLRLLPNPPSRSRLDERIRLSFELYPCDLLFIHRDAENISPDQRFSEIDRAVQQIQSSIELPPMVYVVPIRMMEAWLLFDVCAIRRAAGNPHGRQSFNIPPLHRIEDLADPKAKIYEILRNASGLSGRRLESFNQRVALHRIPDYIEDFSPLHTLSAFRRLENDTRVAIEQITSNP